MVRKDNRNLVLAWILVICLAREVTVAWPRNSKGFPGLSKSDCRVQEECTQPYMSRAPHIDSELRLCASLSIYQRCLARLRKACRAAIYYHTVKILIPVLMRDHKCGNITLPKNDTELLSIFQETGRTATIEPKPTYKPKCKALAQGNIYRNVNTAEKRYCGLFGDPHLRTFNDIKQTCVVQGAWPLIDNKFLIVQVTNVPLVDGFSATATTKITVIINEDKHNCVEQKIYQAKSHDLPGGFVDGSSTTGTSDCKVKVVELEKNSLIQINLCHIGTDIIVRKVSQFLTFHIRMPRKLASSWRSQGLCVSGCPRKEIIDYRELLSSTDAQLSSTSSKKKITRREAKRKCQDSNVTGFYLDSCVFDLITTGDTNFTLAAKSALDDAFLMDPIGTVRDIRTYKGVVSTYPDNSTDTQVKSKFNSAAAMCSTVAVSYSLILAKIYQYFITD